MNGSLYGFSWFFFSRFVEVSGDLINGMEKKTTELPWETFSNPIYYSRHSPGTLVDVGWKTIDVITSLGPSDVQ